VNTGVTTRGTATARPQRGVADLVLVLSDSPGRACAESTLMLARIRHSGLFELLTAAAWGHALGYRPVELSGVWLSALLHGKPDAAELAAALLDEHDDHRPLEVTLQCKDRRRKRFRLHRRFDPYEKNVFVLADEIPLDKASPSGPAAALPSAQSALLPRPTMPLEERAT
jgi:PAS domain-containing protein